MKRMIKILIAGLLLSILTGCGVNEDNLKTVLDQTIQSALAVAAYPSQNQHKSFYSYYLPLNVGKKESTETSVVLEVENNMVLMTLNVSAVVANRYYPLETTLPSPVSSNVLYRKEGTFTDYNKQIVKYAMYISKSGSNTYLLYLWTDYFEFKCDVPISALPNVINYLFAIVRSCRVNHNAVLATYTHKESLNNVVETVDLFKKKVPESGPLTEILEGKDDNYDWSVEESDVSNPNVPVYPDNNQPDDNGGLDEGGQEGEEPLGDE
ncbi:MAG: hypothetical protein LBR25_02805 [Erysipelotrichaceae bacterium]|jgi:hypothetical protein|nr:hypothetical protein [Erysipelotrichaceae bacterium]